MQGKPQPRYQEPLLRVLHCKFEQQIWFAAVNHHLQLDTHARRMHLTLESVMTDRKCSCSMLKGQAAEASQFRIHSVHERRRAECHFYWIVMTNATRGIWDSKLHALCK